MTDKNLLQLAEGMGFSHACIMDTDCLEFMPQVREMCAADKCRSYGKCWTCPPHCGTLEEISSQAAKYRWGILVQSTGKMEDEFDIECMMEIEKLHKMRFDLLVEQLRKLYHRCLPMGAGACSICEKCTCPDEPCRFPEKAITSMEACGLMVSRVCEKAGLDYYYGPLTITYTACVLTE